ncbi:hypothetical protein DP116_18805 [Brasilonema bromeliae SPC951]|uniref:Uncharacterized protein n=1 Tax=Brasilonema bromeliae SPC951 TaxID=385972 RepID=A0ABX1PAA4_9CYAN|nr:hypothetical protein [Brasilonema bromeliae SPC951]
MKLNEVLACATKSFAFIGVDGMECDAQAPTSGDSFAAAFGRSRFLGLTGWNAMRKPPPRAIAFIGVMWTRKYSRLSGLRHIFLFFVKPYLDAFLLSIPCCSSYVLFKLLPCKFLALF